MKERKTNRKRRLGRKRSFGRGLLHFLCYFLETLVLLALGLYAAMYLLVRGPSETAGRLFARSVKETSAIGFLADLYFSPEELEELLASDLPEETYTETRTELIQMDALPANPLEPDAWGFVDEDGDGIILDEVKGEGYAGYMMIVLDPSRVILACDPDSFGRRGYTVEEFVALFGAVAGVNAGAFDDPKGTGNGSRPEGLVAFEGNIYGSGALNGFAAIDSEHILHVGLRSNAEAKEAGIQYGACYGPVLVQNGAMSDERTLKSGLNPRTAIGQRSDGAFLLLVIDGRQVISLGATYQDEAEIMLRYGAVNAVNMDGGSSSMMWYNDGYVNNSASVIGIRRIPTAFVVLPAGEGGETP